MKFQAKTYLRLGASVGSIIGVIAMIFAICFEKTILGVVIMVLCVGVGTIVGNILENKG